MLGTHHRSPRRLQGTPQPVNSSPISATPAGHISGCELLIDLRDACRAHLRLGTPRPSPRRLPGTPQAGNSSPISATPALSTSSDRERECQSKPLWDRPKRTRQDTHLHPRHSGGASRYRLFSAPCVYGSSEDPYTHGASSELRMRVRGGAQQSPARFYRCPCVWGGGAGGRWCGVCPLRPLRASPERRIAGARSLGPVL